MLFLNMVVKMMIKKQLYSEFNRRAKFGNMKSVPNNNSGDNDEVFVPVFSLWCKPQKRTANQSYSIYGTELQNTITIVIRHTESVKSNMKVMYDGHLYNIEINNPDDSGSYLAYDYLTLKAIKKVSQSE